MENYKLLVYLIIGLLYFIFKNKNKKDDVSRPTPSKTSESSSIPQRTTLVKKGKEIVQKSGTINTGKSRNLEAEGMKQSAKPLDYDDLITDEEGKIIVPKMTDVDRESQERFQPYSGKGKDENEFGKLLKSPDSLKKAVVLNEILTPKHF